MMKPTDEVKELVERYGRGSEMNTHPTSTSKAGSSIPYGHLKSCRAVSPGSHITLAQKITSVACAAGMSVTEFWWHVCLWLSKAVHRTPSTNESPSVALGCWVYDHSTP